MSVAFRRDSDEADPATDRISFTAPLTRTMMGLSVGDLADFNACANAIGIIAVCLIKG